MKLTATAFAFPNIAFIKYWGNCDARLNLPSTGSISMNLDGLFTRTRVTFDPALREDELILDGERAQSLARQRVSGLLDHIRRMSGMVDFALVESRNNFPMGSGIASSASAFAALALAGSAAAGLDLSERELARLARLGSGSACRSVPAGFVEWYAGEDDASSFAETIAPADHWALADCIAVVSRLHKPVASADGHARAGSSPLQAARVAGADLRLEACRRAILERDFEALAEVAELDSNLMHAVNLTSRPPLIYWQPASLEILLAVTAWWASGLPVFYTVDAGPNVHVVTLAEQSGQVAAALREIPGVEQVLVALPGNGAYLVDQPI